MLEFKYLTIFCIVRGVYIFYKSCSGLQINSKALLFTDMRWNIVHFNCVVYFPNKLYYLVHKNIFGDYKYVPKMIDTHRLRKAIAVSAHLVLLCILYMN